MKRFLLMKVKTQVLSRDRDKGRNAKITISKMSLLNRKWTYPVPKLHIATWPCVEPWNLGLLCVEWGRLINLQPAALLCLFNIHQLTFTSLVYFFAFCLASAKWPSLILFAFTICLASSHTFLFGPFHLCKFLFGQFVEFPIVQGICILSDGSFMLTKFFEQGSSLAQGVPHLLVGITQNMSCQWIMFEMGQNCLTD